MKQMILLRDQRRVQIANTFNPGDVGRIASFHGEVYGMEYGLGPRFEGYVARTVGAFAETYDSEAGAERIWLAYPEGSHELVSCCAVIRGEENKAQFRWFLTAPPFRGAGLGRFLFSEAVEFSRAAGYESLYLFTADFLPAAASLYQSFGFSVTAEKPFSEWEVPFTEHRYERYFT